MTEGFKVFHNAAVMEIVLACPPSNALDAGQRAALIAALAAVPQGVTSVLLRAEGRVFATDAELLAHQPSHQPDFAALCHAIENCAVPVIAFLQNLGSGPGAEMALACHARLATPMARLAFPALRLGVVSGVGATQRLPRLVGAAQALRLMQGGQTVLAAEALAIGLVDQVIEADTPDAALAAARAVLAGGAVATLHPGARDAGTRDGRAFLHAIAEARAALAQNPHPLIADGMLIDCIEAALLLPYDQGLGYEATVGGETARTAEAAALTHVHLAERRGASTPAPLAKAGATPVRRVVLYGVAPALTGFLMTCLSRGISLTLVEADREKLVAQLQTIAARQEAAVQAGSMTEAQRDADWARLIPATSLDTGPEAEVFITGPDAVLPADLHPKCLLATGRGALASGALRLVVAGRLAELGLPAAAPAQATATALVWLRKMGLTVVLTGAQSGLGISGRLGAAGSAALQSMMQMGVPPNAIEAALAAFGQRVPSLTAPASAGAAQDMAAPEIVQRWLSALANEGARMLAAGMAQSPLDIDLVAVQGMGFPRAKGGPLHQADQRGLMILRRDLTHWADDADIWKPVPALDVLVSKGRGFAGLSA